MSTEESAESLISSTELQTSCSHCGTVFEVSVDVLTAPDSRVRCGECYGIFDALSNLVDSEDAPEELTQLIDQHDPMPEQATEADQADAGTLSTGAAENVSIDLPDLESDESGMEMRGAVRVLDEAESSDEDSKASTLSSASEASLAGLANNATAFDQTLSNPDLFSAEAELPEVPLFDQTRDAGTIDFGEMSAEDDETFNETLAVHDLTVGEPDFLKAAAKADEDAGAVATDTQHSAVESAASAAGNELFDLADDDIDIVTSASADNDLEFNYRDRDDEASAEARLRRKQGNRHQSDEVTLPVASDMQIDGATELQDVLIGHRTDGLDEIVTTREKASESRWPQRIAYAALALSIAGAFWLLRDPGRTAHIAAQNTALRPAYIAICGVVGCEVPARVDFDKIRVLGRHVYSHPEVERALVIEVALRNDADFVQRYPNLEVRLSDVRGQLVAQREFLPTEYIDDWREGDMFAMGKRLDITLEVTDPGEDAASFELEFR